MTTQILTNMSPHITPGLFIFLVVMMVATSPILALTFCYLAYQWAMAPLRREEEEDTETWGDFPHIEGRQ